jgi:hypothetical protein
MHILVVTNETAVGHTLFDTVADLALPARADVTVVAPALNSRLRHWLSDEDAARRAATARLNACLAHLRHVGVRAHGTIGDANPLRAIEDELAVRDADQLVIATHPEHRSNWLELRLVERVRERYALPVLHVIVDLEQRRELLAQAA